MLYITSLNEEIYQVTIYDLKGSIVLLENNLKSKLGANKNILLQTSKINDGIYFVNIQTESGMTVKKWVKQ